MSSPAKKTYIPTRVPKLGDAKRQKVRAIRAARGIPARVGLADVQAHIEWLRDIGFLDDAIGAAAGLPATTVHKIRIGKHATVRIEHASRIRAVSHMPVQAQATLLVPSLGTRRRIHALWALGHSSAAVGASLGVSGQMVVQYCGVERVRGATWFRVRDLYEELSGVPGASRETRRRAVVRGLAAPLDWHGLDIDHPDHSPVPVADSEPEADPVVVHRILSGGYRGEVLKSEQSAVVAYAAANGWSAPRLVEVMGVTRAAADAALTRARRKLREEGAA